MTVRARRLIDAGPSRLRAGPASGLDLGRGRLCTRSIGLHALDQRLPRTPALPGGLADAAGHIGRDGLNVGVRDQCKIVDHFRHWAARYAVRIVPALALVLKHGVAVRW